MKRKAIKQTGRHFSKVRRVRAMGPAMAAANAALAGYRAYNNWKKSTKQPTKKPNSGSRTMVKYRKKKKISRPQ